MGVVGQLEVCVEPGDGPEGLARVGGDGHLEPGAEDGRQQDVKLLLAWGVSGCYSCLGRYGSRL